MSDLVERDLDAVAEIAATIAPDFLGRVPAEEVERLVAESYARLSATARIPTFVPLLTQRLARERLRAVARRELADAGEAGHQDDA